MKREIIYSYLWVSMKVNMQSIGGTHRGYKHAGQFVWVQYVKAQVLFSELLVLVWGVGG